MHQHDSVAESATATMDRAAARGSSENGDFVRALLARKQPGFALVLVAAEQELDCQAPHCLPERSTCPLCDLGHDGISALSA